MNSPVTETITVGLTKAEILLLDELLSRAQYTRDKAKEVASLSVKLEALKNRATE
jgi:hypothetical protein